MPLLVFDRFRLLGRLCKLLAALEAESRLGIGDLSSALGTDDRIDGLSLSGSLIVIVSLAPVICLINHYCTGSYNRLAELLESSA